MRGGGTAPRNFRLARTRDGDRRNNGLGADVLAGLVAFARMGFFLAAGFFAGRGFFFLLLLPFAMAGHASESAEKRQA